jgi:hypothetical protein
LDPYVETCVEAICRKGCRAVWSDIDALADGRSIPETSGLTPQERLAVLEELKAVMAVYEGSCVVG